MGGKGKGDKAPRDEDGAPSDNLYCAGLPEEFDSESVQQFFGAIGNVQQVKSFGHGYALVRFSSLEEATTVKMSLNGQKPIGCSKPLCLTFAQSEKKIDWKCPRCGDMQFQKNTQCRLCGCPRPQSGGAEKGMEISASGDAAGGPKYAEGGDWTCSKCGDLQFKKNVVCRLCGNPAPGADSSLPPPLAQLPVFGKALNAGKGSVGKGDSPYGVKGGKGFMAKDGPKCCIQDFIDELVVGGLPGGMYDPELNCIYVGGLPEDTEPMHLYQIFAAFGPIPPRGARVDQDVDGKCSGFGFVNFMEAAGADMAVMALNGIQLTDGVKLEVRMKAASESLL